MLKARLITRCPGCGCTVEHDRTDYGHEGDKYNRELMSEMIKIIMQDNKNKRCDNCVEGDVN